MSVVVFLEVDNGEFKKSAPEAASYAADLAKAQGSEAIGIAVGKVSQEAITKFGEQGLSKVLHMADGFEAFDSGRVAAAIEQAAKASSANTVVISNTYNGKSIAPRVAARMSAGLVAGVSEMVDASAGIVGRKPVFSNKGFADVRVLSDKAVITVIPNAYKVNVFENNQAAVESFAPQLPEAQVKVVEVKKAEGEIPLTEADIVVSAGRGLKGPENWGIVLDLAKELNAATACSKPVSDLHWRPHSEHVGQTGITIKPNLYIACGISGAIQHLAGVSGSKTIVAINSDKEAPFFKAADYGIVGDVFDILPKLTEAVKRLHSQG